MMSIHVIREASAFSSIAVREAAYARIQEEIAAAEAVIRGWRQRHNELSIISRLPPELLAEVFKHVATQASHESGLWRLDWIRVSYVCSHWRRVALDCPGLWSDIPFSHLKWAEEMLARAKLAPLTIMIPIDNRHRNDVAFRKASVIKLAMTQLSRFKQLTLLQRNEYNSGSNNLHRKFMKLIRLLTSPAPMLETLDISFAVANDKNRLPDNLFQGKSPRLTCLKVLRCGLTWRGPIFANLRSLDVCEVPEALRPPAEQVISALCSMHHLETLRLSFDFAPISGVLISPTRVANFSRLRDLFIQSSLTTSVLLLDHITYPDTVHVKVDCHYSTSDDGPLSMVERLVDNLVKSLAGPIRSISISQEVTRVYTSSGILPRSLANKHPGGGAPIDCQLELRLRITPSSAASSAQVAVVVLQTLPLRDVESLSIIDFHLPKTFWKDKFGDLRRLESLRIGHNPSGFLDAFSYGTTAALEQYNQQDGVKFTALRNLSFEACTLGGDRGFGRTYTEFLKASLRARMEKGVFLAKLEFKQCCYIERRDLKELEEVVERVEWDGEHGTATWLFRYTEFERLDPGFW